MQLFSYSNNDAVRGFRLSKKNENRIFKTRTTKTIGAQIRFRIDYKGSDGRKVYVLKAYILAHKLDIYAYRYVLLHVSHFAKLNCSMSGAMVTVKVTLLWLTQ